MNLSLSVALTWVFFTASHLQKITNRWAELAGIPRGKARRVVGAINAGTCPEFAACNFGKHGGEFRYSIDSLNVILCQLDLNAPGGWENLKKDSEFELGCHEAVVREEMERERMPKHEPGLQAKREPQAQVKIEQGEGRQREGGAAGAAVKAEPGPADPAARRREAQQRTPHKQQASWP